MADLQALLTNLPPGVNVYDALQAWLDPQVYPDLGKAFWIQAYSLAAILSFSAVLFILGLCIKAKRGRLNFIHHDGSCSRIDLKFAVPVFWTCSIVLSLSLTAKLKPALAHHEYTMFIGFVWFMIYLPCSMSYTLLSASVAASAPPLRRYLGRIRYGVVYYNATVIFLVLAAAVGLIIPGVKHAKAMVELNTAHRLVSNAIEEARGSQEPDALNNVLGLLPVVGQVVDEYYRVYAMTSAVCSAYLAMYLATGAIPAVILSRTVFKKIARLEANRNLSSNMQDSNSIASEHIAMPVWDHYQDAEDDTKPSSISRVPEQPKDRPFAALIEMKTTTFPQRFHAIMQDGDQTSQQRADALRAVLKLDLILYSLYFGLVILFLGGTLFGACHGTRLLSTWGNLIFGYSYFAWSKGVPALALSVALMWDALRKPVVKAEDVKHALKKPVGTIQCSQVVNVSYVGGHESTETVGEKKNIHAAGLRPF